MKSIESHTKQSSTNSASSKTSGGGIALPSIAILQQKETSIEEPIQEFSAQQKTPAQFASGTDDTKPVKPFQLKPNNTGLPDNLKSGVENLSGMDLSDVKVHYNSSQPAQLNALAYAQGNDIHVGPGQEKHVPHEAWHVVQQRQGRVQATTQLKAGVAVNDDPVLEHEADVMGEKAMSFNSKNVQNENSILSHSRANSLQLVTQRFLAAGDDYFEDNNFVIVNDIGQFLRRGHTVVPLSQLSSVEWPPNERMLVITGHGDENSVAGMNPEGIAGLISGSSVPEAIPIVLLSCDSAKDRGDGTNFTKDVYDLLAHKRTITGFKGAAILDASGEVMKIVSIRQDKGDQVSHAQSVLENRHKPQEGVDNLASDSVKDSSFYMDAVKTKEVAGFFAEFLNAIQGSIDQTGCVTYHKY